MSATILPQVKHPALRARIADVVWTNDMRKSGVAKIAIDAYCDCVQGLMSGLMKPVHPIDGLSLIDAQIPAHRALQIARAATKTGAALPDRVVTVLRALYAEARKDGQPVIFSRFVKLCVDFKIIEAKEAAPDLETAANATPDIYPDGIRMALDFAGVLYKRAGDQEKGTTLPVRCCASDVEDARSVPPGRCKSIMGNGRAPWLRHIRGEEAQALENDLEDELRRLQRASLREMGSFAVNIEVPAERDRIIEMFSEMDFSTALKSFALLDNSPKMADLKAEALKLGQASALSAMMGIKHIDDEGKTIVNTAGAGRGAACRLVH